MSEPFRIEIPAGETVGACAYPAAASVRRGITLLLAHGAGAGQTSVFMVRCASGLAARGLDAVTFNFPYIERGRRVPDPNAELEGCCRAAIAAVRAREQFGGTLAVGGKSMGGRIASQVAAAAGENIAALVFLGYPLHPPGNPRQLRASHLAKIAAPMLFVQGSRDAFGAPQELRPILAKLAAPADLHVVENADHSFKVPKRAGVAQEDVYDAVLDRVADWLPQIPAYR